VARAGAREAAIIQAPHHLCPPILLHVQMASQQSAEPLLPAEAPLLDPATSDHHIVLVDHAVDADRTEGELLNAHAMAS